MTSNQDVRDALLEFIASRPSNATAVVLLKMDELAMNHIALDLLEEMCKATKTDLTSLGPFVRLREKVRDTLRQAGYAGDPR